MIAHTRTALRMRHVVLTVVVAVGCQSLPEQDDDGDGGDPGGDDTGEAGGEETFGPADDGPAPDAGCGPQCDAFCDPWAQDCPPGQKCTPYSADGDTTWNGLRCSTLAPEPAGLGEDCVAPDGPVAGVDDCDVGLMCWNVDAAGDGICIGLCTGSPTNAGCDDPEALCSVYNEGTLPVCLVSCDPLEQTCPGDQLCIPQGGGGSGFVCAVDANPIEGGYGDPCLAFNKCNPGLFCAPSETVPGCGETAGCCSQFCDLSEPDPDAACDGHTDGQVCVPWFGDAAAPPGFETLGACAIPS